MRALLSDLRKFLTRGNLVDLAVAVVIGTAFGAVVASFTDDVLMQIVAAIGGQPDFSSLRIDVGDGVIRYGAFLNAVINFVIVGTAMFFVVRAAAVFQRAKDEEVAKEVALLTEIRDAIRAQSR